MAGVGKSVDGSADCTLGGADTTSLTTVTNSTRKNGPYSAMALAEE